MKRTTIAVTLALMAWSAVGAAQERVPVEGVVGRWLLPTSLRIVDGDASKHKGGGGQSSMYTLAMAQDPKSAVAAVTEICVPGQMPTLARDGLIGAAIGDVRNPTDSRVELGRYPATRRSGDSGDRPGFVHVAWVPISERGLASVKLVYPKGLPQVDELIAAIEAMDVVCGEPQAKSQPKPRTP